MEQIPTNLVFLVEVNSLSQFLEVRSPGVSLTGSWTDGLTRLQSQYWLCCVPIWRLEWERIPFKLVLFCRQDSFASGIPGGSDGKESAPSAGDLGSILGWEDILEKKWPPTPVFLPGEFHGLKIPVGCSAWSCKQSDRTEPLTLSHFGFHLLVSAWLEILAGYGLEAPNRMVLSPQAGSEHAVCFFKASGRVSPSSL